MTLERLAQEPWPTLELAFDLDAEVAMAWISKRAPFGKAYKDFTNNHGDWNRKKGIKHYEFNRDKLSNKHGDWVHNGS